MNNMEMHGKLSYDTSLRSTDARRLQTIAVHWYDAHYALFAHLRCMNVGPLIYNTPQSNLLPHNSSFHSPEMPGRTDENLHKEPYNLP